MKLKRIYIEITNQCNLNCSFCLPHHREKKFMTLLEFQTILNKIKTYTEYIYLHVKGEPLFHPEINTFIKLAYDQGFKINLTTNGTLLKEHLEITKYLRQINLSLHATNRLDILQTAKEIKDCIVCIRIWRIEQSQELIHHIEEEFHVTIPCQTNFTLAPNLFLSQEKEFIWPSLQNEFQFLEGYCHALKDQIAILVDGSVVPCCLDNEGDMNLGNILQEDLATILVSTRAQAIKKGFQKRIAVEKLCQKCSFKNKF